MTPPLCRNCGGPIGRRLATIFFGEQKASRPFTGLEYRTEKPADKDEAGRFTNHRIISSKRHYNPVDPFVARITTWDGESYRDEFFCKDVCAQAFGRMTARHCPEVQTVAYAEAVKARDG